MTEKQETKTIKDLSIGKLKPFTGHPYRVVDDDEMDRLVESIQEHGVMTPIYVRPIDGGYEVISGHRRIHAAKRAGLDSVPAIKMDMTRDEAAIALVDSNLHRERLLPSEKAFAYKLKLEALSRQGKRTDLTSSQVATKLDTAERVGSSSKESRDTVYRYIRLTNLIPPLLRLVDEGRIAFTPAVELSYLTPEEQELLFSEIGFAQATPSLSQACHMKRLSAEGRLTEDKIMEIMAEEKPNQREKISFTVNDLQRFFPGARDAADIRAAIIRLLEREQKNRQKEQGYDER